jgi:hypothetical protein
VQGHAAAVCINVDVLLLSGGWGLGPPHMCA